MSKIFRYSLLGVMILVQSLAFDVSADKLTHLRTSKKIVPVNNVSAPYFAIQILALKRSPQNPSYFRNVDRAREFDCADGYVRYTIGSYSSKEAAMDAISGVKSLGYQKCFVVDLRSYNLNGKQSSADNFSPRRNTTYTIQLAAFRYPVYLNHFEEFDNVMEFYPEDRVYRYTVGQINGSKALEELNRIKAMGYPQAHLVPFDKYRSFRIE